MNNRTVNFLIIFFCLLAFSCKKKYECIDLDFLLGEWQGEFCQDDFGTYEMRMEVCQINGCSFEGILNWPSLRNSTTKMEGYFDDNRFYWTEPELLSGSSIELDGKYEAPFITEAEICGSWRHSGLFGSEGGTFSIAKIEEGGN